jgi:hypothetical protein
MRVIEEREEVLEEERKGRSDFADRSADQS